MITFNVKFPQKLENNEEETSNQIEKLLSNRKNQLNEILKKDLTEESRRKLKIERKFLELRPIYQSVLGKIIDGMKNNHNNMALF